MKKILLSALLASSTLGMLADSVFAKECTFKDGTEKITVDDPNNSVTLRTNYEKEGRDVPGAGTTKPIISDDETLLIDNNKSPKLNKNDKLCYYPVKLTQENNPKNTNDKILSFNTYWISEKGIADYQKYLTKSAPPQSTTPEESGGSQNRLPSWLPLTLISVLNFLTLGLLIYSILLQEKKSKSIESKLDKKITNSFQLQNTKLSGELQSLQHHAGRNKEHIKQLEELLKSQNQYLYDINYYIKSGNLSSSLSDSLKKIFEAMLESRQSELNKPSLASSNEQNEDSQQETEQTNYHDPFYDEVISQFNTASLQWFSSLIEQRNIGKVQITKDSVLGQMDMGGKVTQLEFNEQGTLLIYQAGEQLWIIPDLTQSKWKRAITSSLFNGGGQILVRPAEVESVGNHLWQVKEKGEFR